MAELLLSPRLRLRPAVADDLAFVTALYADPLAMRHLGGALDRDAATRRFEAGRRGGLRIVEGRDPDPHRIQSLGTIELNGDTVPTPRLTLEPESWGDGLASEILWLLMRTVPGSVPDPLLIPGASHGSRRVAERCGFHVTGHEGGLLVLAARNDRDERMATLDDWFSGLWQRRVDELQEDLGIPAVDAAARPCLQRIAEASRLVEQGQDVFERDLLLAPEVVAPLERMLEAATGDEIILQVVSGFRDIDYQAALVRRKVDAGTPMDDILRVSAAPGCSEHHTGRVVDLTTPSCVALEEEFEDTPAFAWLTQHAQRYGFFLSYPRGNDRGIAYEPWHWAWRPDLVGR